MRDGGAQRARANFRFVASSLSLARHCAEWVDRNATANLEAAFRRLILQIYL
jgi:hypothetical protein